MNIWIEARVAKRIFGSVRAVGERFQGPIYAALAMASRGDVVQVSGPHPPVDRNAPAKPEPMPEPEPEAALSPADELLAVLVGEALGAGTKDRLVEALEAVGLDPEDYSNNGKRKAALHAWLED